MEEEERKLAREAKDMMQDLQSKHEHIYAYLVDIFRLCQMAGLDETEYGIYSAEDSVLINNDGHSWQWHFYIGLKRRDWEKVDQCLVGLQEGMEAFFQWQEQVLPKLLADVSQVLKDTKGKVSRRNKQIETLRQTRRAK